MSKATRRFIVNKVLEMLITLVVVTLISFLLVRLSPIDPAEAYARRSFAAFSFTDEQMEALREDMGLNDPLPVQYVTWVRDALHLDFGKSFVSGQPVFEKVTTAIGITVTIVLISAVIQAVFILLFGCLCYLTRKRMIGHALIFLCIAGVSIPSFFFASTYLDIFAVKLGLTSVAGNTGLMRYLPAAVCIGIGCIALFSPMLANNIQKEMEQDSAFYARCRGLWGAIRESSLLKCNNPAHKYHCVPDVEDETRLKTVLPDCIMIMNKTISFLDEIYGIPEQLLNEVINFEIKPIAG